MMKEIPVYKNSGTYAREHDELPAYRASMKANIACKEAIESAIREHYRRNSLDANAVQNVMQEFGSQRVAHVLAATVKAKDWDARFSPENRAWAVTIPTPPNLDPWGDDRNLHFVVNSHSGLTNLFLNQFRTAQEREKKPSVVQQLKPVQHASETPVSGKHIQER